MLMLASYFPMHAIYIFDIHLHFFSFIKTKQIIHNSLIVDQKIPVNRSSNCLSTIEQLSDVLISICLTSHVILTSSLFTSKGQMALSQFANMSHEDMQKLIEDAFSQNTKNVIYIAWKFDQ